MNKLLLQFLLQILLISSIGVALTKLILTEVSLATASAIYMVAAYVAGKWLLDSAVKNAKSLEADLKKL